MAEDEREPERTPQEAMAAALKAEPTAPAAEPTPQAPVATGGAEEREPEAGAETTATVAETGAPAVTQKPGESDQAFEKRYWDSQRHIQKIQQENAELRAEQKLRKEAEERERSKPTPLSPEEQERDAAALIERINKNPRQAILELQREALAKAEQGTLSKAEALIAEKLAALEPLQAQATQAKIQVDLAKKYPEITDPKFQALMNSRENVEAAWNDLSPEEQQDPVAVHRSPSFHKALYLQAKLKAAQDFKPTQEAGAAAQAGQAGVARGQATVAAGGSGAGSPAAKAKLTPDDKLRQDIREAGTSPQARMDKAFQPAKLT